jgi:hypothetical protein
VKGWGSVAEFTLYDSLLVERPPATVWHVLTRFERERRWPGGSSVTPLSPQPFGTGSRFREHAKRGPFWATFLLECTEWEPDRVFAWRAKSFGVWGEHRWELRPQPGGTQVLDSERFWGPQPLVLFARLIFPLFGVKGIRRRLLESIRRASLLEHD